MEKFDVVIIGSGLGGLQCGYILAKNGLKVCILEQHHQIGGCLQTFQRNGISLDTGFHFVGGLKEGEPLHALFTYFDLLDLPWHPLDEDGFAEVFIQDKSWKLPNGFDRYADYLSDYFPQERANLNKYSDFLRQVSDHTLDAFLDPENNPNARLMEHSAYHFIEDSFKDQQLRNVISGVSLSMDLCSETLPLYVFAQINSSFIQSAWRMKGGGSQIAQRLAENFKKMGGTILTSAKVTGMKEENGKIGGLIFNETEQLHCDYVISDIHPAQTLALIKNSTLIRPIYVRRIRNLANSKGMFTVHLLLKAGKVLYRNRNIFIHTHDDIWNKNGATNETSSILVNYQLPEEQSAFAENIDLLTLVDWNEMHRWEESFIGKRGDEYKEYKAEKAAELIRIAEEKIPELKGNIEKYYTSTPLTYRDYTGTWHGSAFGIKKDYDHLMFTMLTPKTQIPNLFLTGQNLNLHGILGVSMTSLFTSAHIIGKENINLIKKEI